MGGFFASIFKVRGFCETFAALLNTPDKYVESSSDLLAQDPL